MKRSKMLRIIQDAVYMASWEELCLTDEEANEVLKKIEAAGMLPPRTEFAFEVGKSHDGSTEYTHHNWEPED